MSIRPGHKLIYLASPYSKCPLGIERAADEAAKCASRLMRAGHRVFSPIAHTHAIAMAGGIDPLDAKFWQTQDDAVMDACDALAVLKLPGWDTSVGVEHEVSTFDSVGKPVYYLPWIEVETKRETVIEEAHRITSGDRDADYGHPAEHWSRTVGMINAMLGIKLEPRQWGQMMILDKLAREQNKPKRDNLTDICGYARCIERVDEHSKRGLG